MKFTLAYAALGALAVGAVQGANLRDMVKHSLDANVEVEAEGEVELAVQAEGVNNCQNKCYNLLGYLSYFTAQEQMASPQTQGNNEFRACMIGCNQCLTIQSNPKNQDEAACFDYCKTYNYAGQNPQIQKGVIEPDKACIIGCVIQLCQVVCTGGAPWQGHNSQGGCLIQSGYGISTYQVANTGAGFAACCTPLQNLCTYRGRVPNPNYNSILTQTYSTCAGSTIGGISITRRTSVTDLCRAYENAFSRDPPQCGAPQPVG